MKFRELMMVIADSGSTKTHWRFIDGDNIEQYETVGLNPYFSDEGVIKSVVNPLVERYPNVKEVYFYGSGCAEGSSGQMFLRAQLQNFFVSANIGVYSDLLGAARACYGSSSGLIGILGTGSNTAYYDGTSLQQKVPSLGYLLGDEGSGVYLGRLLLSTGLRGELPTDLLRKLNLDKELIFKRLYESSSPNRFLASFGPFLFRNKMVPEVSAILQESFGLYLDRYVSVYGEGQTLSVVGSIGFYFRTELQEALRSRGHFLGQVLEHPIAALSLYHLAE